MREEQRGRRRTFAAGMPRALFQVRTRSNRGYAYDVSADGQRFLVSVVGDAVGDIPN